MKKVFEGTLNRKYLLQYEKYTIHDEAIAISVHTSSRFDHKSTTRESAIALNQLVRSEEIELKSISLIQKIIGGKLEHNHYLPIDQVDLPIQSAQGAHKLSFTNLRKVVFSGGYFNSCLKNTFRDIFNGIKKLPGQVDFYFVTNAIYVSDTSIPNLSRPKLKNLQKYTSGLSQFPLEKIVSSLSESQLVKYLESNLIDYRNGLLHFNGIPVKNKVIPRNLKINFYRNGRHLKTFGRSDFEVNIVLTSLENLIESMNMLN